MSVKNAPIVKVNDYNKFFKPVQLDVTEFNQHIQDHGVRIVVYKTMLCPNVKHIDGGEHEILCPVCRRGFIDFDPIPAWMFVQNQTLIKDFNVAGTWDNEMVAASFTSEVSMNYFAKVELTDFTTNFSERVQRQEANVDRLKYPAYSVNAIIDSAGKRYTYQKEFTLTVDGDIEWISSDSPLLGTKYAIHYEYNITYRAINALHDNRFGQEGAQNGKRIFVQYPSQWMIKKDYLITREDVKKTPLSENRIFDV